MPLIRALSTTAYKPWAKCPVHDAQIEALKNSELSKHASWVVVLVWSRVTAEKGWLH